MPPPWSLLRRLPLKSAPAIFTPRSWAGSFLISANILLSAHVFFTYIGGIGSTSGISMMPTIPHSSHNRAFILFSCLHRRGRGIKVGDVITYTNPIRPHQMGCKRVIGMPGDFVAVMTPGRGEADVFTVDVDGKWASMREEMIRVPEGHCWVVGDNLEWSRDSRLFGPLPLALVKAKVLAVVLPRRDAKWVGSEMDMVDVGTASREWVSK